MANISPAGQDWILQAVSDGYRVAHASDPDRYPLKDIQTAVEMARYLMSPNGAPQELEFRGIDFRKGANGGWQSHLTILASLAYSPLFSDPVLGQVLKDMGWAAGTNPKDSPQILSEMSQFSWALALALRTPPGESWVHQNMILQGLEANGLFVGFRICRSDQQNPTDPGMLSSKDFGITDIADGLGAIREGNDDHLLLLDRFGATTVLYDPRWQMTGSPYLRGLFAKMGEHSLSFRGLQDFWNHFREVLTGLQSDWGQKDLLPGMQRNDPTPNTSISTLAREISLVYLQEDLQRMSSLVMDETALASLGSIMVKRFGLANWSFWNFDQIGDPSGKPFVSSGGAVRPEVITPPKDLGSPIQPCSFSDGRYGVCIEIQKPSGLPLYCTLAGTHQQTLSQGQTVSMTRHLQRLVSAMHRSHGASNNRLIDLATTMQRRNGITSSGAPLREVELRAFAYWLDEIEHEYDILCEQKPDSAPKRLDYVKDRIQTLTGWKHASYYNHLRESKQWRAEGFL